MNMISNGSFLAETDASNKQEALVKKLTSAWEKKNSKAARAGGASLMALSLAACGGEDDTAFSQADIDAAKVTALTDASGTAHATVDAAITSNDAAIAAAVDITTDNAAAVAAALTDASGTAHATVDAAITSNDAAIAAAVDTSADDAAAVTLAYRNAAAELGVTGTSTMTDAELITAIKTANDAAIAAGVDLTTDNTAAINTAVAADTSFDTLAELVAAYDALANPTQTSFTLTNSSNQSTGGADNFTGSAGNDTFLAVADQSLDNGDVIDGGAGTDTLTARYAVDADTTINTSLTNVEKLVIDTDEGDSAANHELNVAVAFTGLEEVRIKDALATDAAGTDDINITSIALGVDVAVENGDGVFDVDFQYASATGTTDEATLNVASADVETVTIANIETLTINGESGDSDIATLTTTAATTVNITGSGNVDVNNIDDVTETINAANATGDVEIRGIGAVDSVITGGAGSDTFDIGGNLDADDTIAGGDGTDRVVVSGSETAELAGVTSIEEVEIDTDDIGDSTTVTISGAAMASATKFIARANTATDNDEATLAFTNLDDGDTIEFLSGGSDSGSLADGVSITTAVASDTTTNTLTLEFDGIGAVTTDTTDDTGLANVEVDEIETLTIVSNANSTGATTTNEIEELDIAVAESLVFSGTADFDANEVVNTTALTSVTSSAMTGDLTLTGLDASALTLTDGSGDLTVTMSGLNNSDTIDGGTGTDTVTGLSVTGRTATTGNLNVSNVDTLIMQATGANTFDLSSLSSVGVFAISGATPGTQTLTNVAAGQVIQLGEATGAGVAFDNGDEVDITMADATGTADSLTINVENDAAGTDAAIDLADVETVNLVVSEDTNNATVDMTLAEADTINVTGGAAGALLTLDTLAANTTTVDLSGYDGEVSFSGANATSAMTVTASSSAAADVFTLSDEDDTVTIAATGAVDVDVDAGAGTDTMNLTVTTGFVDTGEIDNVENLNITVVSGVDISIGANGTAGTDANAIAEATTVTITGGNALSTFEVGDESAASADNITAAVDIDASAFQGNVFLEYAADTLTATTDVDAGALTTDTVYALFDATNTDIVLPFTGVETFIADLNSGDDAAGEQYTFDVDGATGLTDIEVGSVDGQDTLLDIDNYHSGITVQLGADLGGTETDFFASSEVDINLASANGSTDTANVHFLNTEDQTGTIDIDAAGVEVLNLTLEDNTESHRVDLAGVTATTDENTTINVSGGASTDGLIISNVDTSVNVIDASDLEGTLTLSDRGSGAMTITGGSADDTLRMENASDVMTGGSGTDTLEIVQNAVLGGFNVDLSATGDQLTTYNGSSNSAVQSGFENVDLSGITGSNAADITANAGGSLITGTRNTDQITLGDGEDDVVIVSKADGGSDVIASFTTAEDDFDFNGDLVTGTAGQGEGTNGTAVNYSASAIVDVAADTAAADATAGAIFNVNEALTITNGDTVADIESDAATQLSDGAADFSANFAANEGGLVLMDNGTDTFVFEYKADDTTTNSDEINLVAILTGVADSDDLVAGDFI